MNIKSTIALTKTTFVSFVTSFLCSLLSSRNNTVFFGEGAIHFFQELFNYKEV